MYSEVLALFAAAPYDSQLTDLSNLDSHLTNTCRVTRTAEHDDALSSSSVSTGDSAHAQAGCNDCSGKASTGAGSAHATAKTRSAATQHTQMTQTHEYRQGSGSSATLYDPANDSTSVNGSALLHHDGACSLTQQASAASQQQHHSSACSTTQAETASADSMHAETAWQQQDPSCSRSVNQPSDADLAGADSTRTEAASQQGDACTSGRDEVVYLLSELPEVLAAEGLALADAQNRVQQANKDLQDIIGKPYRHAMSVHRQS